MAMNLEGPQQYSSNGRVKTLNEEFVLKEHWLWG